LSPKQKKRLKKRTRVSPEAYDEYLRGRYHWNSRSIDGFRRALEHFDRAIAHDPLYAAAWAGLGDTYTVMAYYGIAAPLETYPKAHAAALRAIELDPELADPHVTLGVGGLFWQWNWVEAERSFQTAIRLNPNLARAQLLFGLYHSTIGRHDEALRLARLARELEPLSPVVNMGIPWAFHFGNRPAEALDEARRVEELAPGFEEAGNMQIACLERLGRYEEAAAILKRQPYWGLPLDADALLEACRADGAPAYLAKRLELIESAAELPSGVREYQIGLALIWLGRFEEAIESLQRSVNRKANMCAFINVDPGMLPLHQHPRFAGLVEQVGVGR
jgi:tetratricopeptide (TPR) repeat protein